MNKEDRIETWGTIIFLLSVVFALGLIIYSGIATKKYESNHWGEHGFIWVYIFVAIALLLQSIVLKQILDGIAEGIRLKRKALAVAPDVVLKSCPACDEQVRDAAKVCRYCRYMFIKKVVKDPLS